MKMKTTMTTMIRAPVAAATIQGRLIQATPMRQERDMPRGIVPHGVIMGTAIQDMPRPTTGTQNRSVTGMRPGAIPAVMARGITGTINTPARRIMAAATKPGHTAADITHTIRLNIPPVHRQGVFITRTRENSRRPHMPMDSTGQSMTNVIMQPCIRPKSLPIKRSQPPVNRGNRHPTKN